MATKDTAKKSLHMIMGDINAKYDLEEQIVKT